MVSFDKKLHGIFFFYELQHIHGWIFHNKFNNMNLDNRCEFYFKPLKKKKRNSRISLKLTSFSAGSPPVK